MLCKLLRRVTYSHVGDDFQFSRAVSFNRNIGEWDVSSVTNMGYMVRTLGLPTVELERTLNGTPESFACNYRCYHKSLRVQHRSIKTCAHGTRCWIDLQMSYLCLAVVPIILNTDVNPSTIPKLAARDPFVPQVVCNPFTRPCCLLPLRNNLYPMDSRGLICPQCNAVFLGLIYKSFRFLHLIAFAAGTYDRQPHCFVRCLSLW
jgi:hypothetical protein